MIQHLMVPELVPVLLTGAALLARKALSLDRAAFVGTMAALAAFLLSTVLSMGTGGRLDTLSQPLLPYVTLVFACMFLAAPRVDCEPATIARMLTAEALAAALFSTRSPVLMAVYWALSAVPVWAVLKGRSAPAARVFLFYAGASAALLAAGVAVDVASPGPSVPGIALVALAVMIHKGVFPFHSWVPVLFEEAPVWTALALAMPQTGAYVVMRLVVPAAAALGRGVLATIGAAALFTALYAAALALVQKEARRALAFVLLSQLAMVLAGLDSATVIGLTGGLTLWLSSGLALTGFGLTVRVLEARRGKLRLDVFHGGHERMPLLAATFLILGLASVGFPGTLGFVAQDMLVSGAIEAYPLFGVAVVLVSAMNGITVLRAYLALFCGARDRASTSLRLLPREAAAVLALVVALLATGIAPSGVVASRSRAAAQALPGGPR